MSTSLNIRSMTYLSLLGIMFPGIDRVSLNPLLGWILFPITVLFYTHLVTWNRYVGFFWIGVLGCSLVYASLLSRVWIGYAFAIALVLLVMGITLFDYRYSSVSGTRASTWVTRLFVLAMLFQFGMFMLWVSVYSQMDMSQIEERDFTFFPFDRQTIKGTQGQGKSYLEYDLFMMVFLFFIILTAHGFNLYLMNLNKPEE